MTDRTQAVIVPAAGALAPAPAQEAEQPLVPLLGGAAPVQAPDAAPAPTPAPPLSVECSESGSNNRESPAECKRGCMTETLLVASPYASRDVLADLSAAAMVSTPRM